MVAFEVSGLDGFAFSSACLSYQGCSEVAVYWGRPMVISLAGVGDRALLRRYLWLAFRMAHGCV
jgi:hypothetical protein